MPYDMTNCMYCNLDSCSHETRQIMAVRSKTQSRTCPGSHLFVGGTGHVLGLWISRMKWYDMFEQKILSSLPASFIWSNLESCSYWNFSCHRPGWLDLFLMFWLLLHLVSLQTSRVPILKSVVFIPKFPTKNDKTCDFKSPASPKNRNWTLNKLY